MKRCRSFGFTPEQVVSFEHPRVVFEIDSQDYSPEHFDKYNASDKKEQSEEARIVKYSKIIKPGVLRGIADVYRKYQFNFGNVYASPSAIQEIMGYFIKGGVISQAEEPRYFDGTKISASGKQFVQEYTLGAVLSESVVRALYGEGMGDLKLKVIDAAPLLLENWSMGSYSVVEELNKAVSYAIAYTRDLINGTFVVPKLDKDVAKGMSSEDKLASNLRAFGEWAKQGDLLEDRNPVTLKLAGSLVYSGPLFKSYLERLNDATASAAMAERETEEAGNAGLFGDTSPDRGGLLERAVASWNRRNSVKREILGSVVMEGDMGGLIVSGVKERVMKWTSAKPENRQAWQQAVKLFRENFGRPPKSEEDAKILLKTAGKMAKSGDIMTGDQFKQEARQTVTGEQPGYAGGQPGSSGQEGGGGSQWGPGGSVPAGDPVKLFTAIRALYKNGQVSREQLDRAFRKVVASVQRVHSVLRNDENYTAGKTKTVMSPVLKNRWDQVKSFISRLRDRGIRAKDQIIDALQQAFRSFMTPQLAVEAYQQYAVFAGFSPNTRFQCLGVEQRRLIRSGIEAGAVVRYKPVSVEGFPDFILADVHRLVGQVGKVRSIRSEVYNVEFSDGEVVSALESELSLVDGGSEEEEEIVSGRGRTVDSVRDEVREFLLNVPTLTRVPADSHGIKKERIEADHVVYLHTETLPDGKPYTVEFHVDPNDNYCDVYVIRDLDNHSLGGDPISIDDIEDWSLGEADGVDARLSNELASHTGGEEVFVEEEDEPYAMVANSSLGAWLDRVGKGVFSGADLNICDGLQRELFSSFGGVEGTVSEGDIYSTVPPGARPFLMRTLDTVDKVVKQPLTAVDDLVDSLVKGVSKKKSMSNGKNRVHFN
jgi:hypothetical protein